MKKIYSTIMMLAMLIAALSFIACSSSSENEGDEIIQFKDGYTEGLCVQYFDKNGDSKLSKSEAAAVVDLQSIFKYNKNIIYFDELKYFTKLSYIGKSAFERAENLINVSLPQSIVTIDEDAFEYCKSLEKVDIPNGIKDIRLYAFRCCHSLTSVTIPGSVDQIGYGPFEHCIKLSSIIVDKNNKVYDSRDNCNCIIETATNKIIQSCIGSKIPSSVTILGEGSFRLREDLTKIDIPENIVSLEKHVFWECTNLEEVVIPSKIESIGEYALACDNLKRVYIKSKNPPVLNGDPFDIRFHFDKNITIYVPKESVETYKSNNYWSIYANYIMPIE